MTILCLSSQAIARLMEEDKVSIGVYYGFVENRSQNNTIFRK